MAIRKSDMNLDNPPVYVVETNNDGTVHEIGQAESSLISNGNDDFWDWFCNQGIDCRNMTGKG